VDSAVIASSSRSQRVLVTGGTGYLGRALIPELQCRGHHVHALVRPGSERKFSADVATVLGNPLDVASVAAALSGTGADTLVHLVGVPKPSPAKARQFREIDLASIRASVAAIERAETDRRIHLIYLSVAQPAPVMQAYLAVRAEGEALIRSRGLNATCLRPWYVLGPGHRWPYLLMPFYAVLRRIPATRASAERLGFVTLTQMTSAIVEAVENPSAGVRVVEVPEIKRLSVT
jgi:uncharacterized protein YbjT (DUF2867 family)